MFILSSLESAYGLYFLLVLIELYVCLISQDAKIFIFGVQWTLGMPKFGVPA